MCNIWSRRSDLNRGPADYESAALPLSYAGFSLIAPEQERTIFTIFLVSRQSFSDPSGDSDSKTLDPRHQTEDERWMIGSQKRRIYQRERTRPVVSNGTISKTSGA
jgi:hypothetical protein